VTPVGRLAGWWHEAAQRVAAAADLLATHRGPDGQHRSPQAWLLDEPEVRAAGLGQLAQLAGAAAGSATGLGLRLLQAPGVCAGDAATCPAPPASWGRPTSCIASVAETTCD